MKKTFTNQRTEHNQHNSVKHIHEKKVEVIMNLLNWNFSNNIQKHQPPRIKNNIQQRILSNNLNLFILES